MDNDSIHFRSINNETGLLEDIEEVRELGLGLVGLLKQILRHPVIRLLMSPGEFIDDVSFTVMCESLLTIMSQAEFVRRTAGAAGFDPLTVEREIRDSGLSETLPRSHPDAPKPALPPLDPNDPLVKDSIYLSEIARHPEWLATSGSKAEKVELSPEMEKFLLDLLRKEKDEPEADQPPAL